MPNKAVFEFHARFEIGHVSVRDNELSGRPVTRKSPENVEGNCELIHEDRCRTIHQSCLIQLESIMESTRRCIWEKCPTPSPMYQSRGDFLENCKMEFIAKLINPVAKYYTEI